MPALIHARGLGGGSARKYYLGEYFFTGIVRFEANLPYNYAFKLFKGLPIYGNER